MHPPGPVNFNGPTGLTWRHAFRLVFDPLNFLRSTSQQYGDLSFFRLFHHRGYFVNNPELIAQIMIYQADKFEKLPRQMKIIEQIFGRGILVTENQEWKRDRQYMQKYFDSELMQNNSRVAVEITRKWIRQTETLNTGKPFDLAKEMSQLSAEITASLFANESGEWAEELGDAMVKVSDSFSREMNSILPTPDWIPIRRNREKLAAIRFFDQYFDNLLKKKKTGAEKTKGFVGLPASKSSATWRQAAIRKGPATDDVDRGLPCDVHGSGLDHPDAGTTSRDRRKSEGRGS